PKVRRGLVGVSSVEAAGRCGQYQLCFRCRYDGSHSSAGLAEVARSHSLLSAFAPMPRDKEASMFGPNRVSRRGFVGGVASALGYLSFKSPSELWAQARGGGGAVQPRQRTANDYDLLAKLANNENPYGPPESVMKAMTGAFKYANRYGYPDG